MCSWILMTSKNLMLCGCYLFRTLANGVIYCVIIIRSYLTLNRVFITKWPRIFLCVWQWLCIGSVFVLDCIIITLLLASQHCEGWICLHLQVSSREGYTFCVGSDTQSYCKSEGHHFINNCRSEDFILKFYIFLCCLFIFSKQHSGMSEYQFIKIFLYWWVVIRSIVHIACGELALYLFSHLSLACRGKFIIITSWHTYPQTSDGVDSFQIIRLSMNIQYVRKIIVG